MSVVNVIEVQIPCMIMECHTVRDMKPALGLFGEVLFKEVVELVFKKYENSVCVNLGKPLFNEDAWRDAKAVLEDIRVGHVSDVVGGPTLYTEVRYDKNGLMVHRCLRGTSSVECSVHMNIIRKFASYNAGPRLADMVLADYRLYHNIDVGSTNRFGKIHKGHYSSWLSQAINTLISKNNHPPIEE
ncbi:unnamed protein product [Mucor hiemalis]